MKSVLVAGPYSRDDLARLAGSANLLWLKEMDPQELDVVLPSVDCIIVQFWPKELTSERLAKMTSLSFVQCGLAGVDHIPFRDLRPGVVVSSNAGGYSDEVGEFAWALLLSSAKRIVRFSGSVKENQSKSPKELGREVVVLKGRVLGILGYGGIGGAVARVGIALGMKVRAFSRRDVSEEGVESFRGDSGLETMLRESDALVLALPMTKKTERMIGRERLRTMKKDAILVNVGRADVVDQQAMYDHLLENRDFVYATDVWWTRGGKEVYPPELPFIDLPNFIGSPHVAGPSAVTGGGPLRNSVENLRRYLDGEAVKGVVDRTDYT